MDPVIYAVEKNPNAVITLKNRVLSEGWKTVTVIEGDMRHWKSPQLAHIIVSELLGSWGDNECELWYFIVLFRI